ncbi:MAG: hypothetical protein MUF64_11120 [Polyangiaceae bacterium]|nr:hypothetical protein [Polyangiaceae bacterium]
MSAARLLPLRSPRAQRLPRRLPSTLRSVTPQEASGAPAPAAPPPSSAPPAAPPASAPPAAPPPAPESGERERAVEEGQEKPATLPKGLDFLAHQMSWALSDFDGARDSARRIERALASPELNLRFIASETRGLIASLNALEDELRQIAGRIGGMDDGASIATHAARLARLAGYSDDIETRRAI